jgi:amino acid adenylation domain-containing protein
MKTLDQLLAELRQQGVKLWVEEDRLRFRAAKDALTAELLDEIKIRKVEIIKFLNQATESTSSQLPPITPIPRDRQLPLSFAQQRLWFLHQFEPDSSSNNMPVVVRFTGSLNIDALEQSFQALAYRHEVLRTHFPSVNGQPSLVIASDVNLPLPVVDLHFVASAQRDTEALRLATEEARRPFDLANGPILRLLLLRLSNDEHLLVWNMHCMICDGASSDVFYQDLTTLYKAFSSGKPSPLEELPVQYVDYAHWQREWLQGDILESQLEYWKQKLEGTLPVIQLPTDRPRPPIVQTYRGDRCARMLPQTLNTALHNLSQKLGATHFMTLIATFEILLHRHSQEEDILISFASAGRSQVETEGLVGFFSNTLIQRINFKGNPTFRELLNQVRKESLDAYAHQDLPFEKLVEELDSEQTQSRSPLFQVKFALNPPWSNGRGMASIQLPDLTITSLFGYIYHGKTKYDLILVMREQDEGLGMVFDYNADLFDSSTIERMLGHFETLLEGIVANPDCKVSELPLLTLAERQQILEEWNHHTSIQPSSTSIHIQQHFEAQAQLTPEAIALICKDQELTYSELNHRANQLAHYLKSLGIKPEMTVGVFLERSLESIIAILAVLKAGGIYVPLNPSDSSDHLDLILQEARISVILTRGLISKTLTKYSIKLVCLDTDWETIAQQPTGNLPVDIRTDALAMVLYPDNAIEPVKGICLTHKSIVQQVSNTDFEVNAADVSLQVAPFSSATAVFEVWGSLLKGGKLVVSQANLLSPVLLGQIIQQYQVTILSLPTRLFHQIVDKQLDKLKSVHKILVEGDWLSPNHVQRFRQFLPHSLLFNVYSVSENTGFTCACTVTDSLPTYTTIPIGRAIAQTQTYVLDHHLQVVPVNVVGELYIGGDHLIQGYYNRPELTDAAFISNPFSQRAGSQLYKTGDLVRYLPDGNLEFVSRIDELVLIQGLQIETGRIETTLCQHPAIREAYVLGRQKNSSTGELVAYVVLHPLQTTTIVELRQFLKQKLSAYMVPTVYIFLEDFPLKQNGKINRHALPREGESTNLSKESTHPHDEVELRLSNIWKNLLGCDSISIHENFFELGGNSLLSVRLVTEIEKTFNYYFPLSSFFQMSTIAEIAQWIREKPSEASSLDDVPPGLCQEDYRAFLSLCGSRVGKHIGKRGLFVEVSPDEMKSSHPFIWIGYIDFSKNLGLQQPIYTVPGCSWTPFQATENYIEAIASVIVEELLSVQPESPYLLGGNCFEGIVAMEVAQQLQKQGKQVELLGIINKPGPSAIYSFFRKLDLYYCALRFHLLALMELPLINKLEYISQRLFRYRSSQSPNKTHDKQDLNSIQNEYDRILPQTWESINQAIKSYVPQEYSGKVILTAPTKSELSSDKKDLFWTDLSWLYPYYGWERILNGKVKLRKIQCAHPDIGMKQNAEKIGEILWNESDKTRHS